MVDLLSRGGQKKPTGVVTKERHDTIVGGTAGDHTLTGIVETDLLISVHYQGFTLEEAAPPTVTYIAEDLTDEFKGAAAGITAADTISNPGGTDTSDGWLIVRWYDRDWKEQEIGFIPGGG